MRTRIDARSLVIGLLLGVCGMLAAGAGGGAGARDAGEPDYDLEFASPRTAFLYDRRNGTFQRLDVSEEGAVQFVGNAAQAR